MTPCLGWGDFTLGDVPVDPIFKNVKVNANDEVYQHHGSPANAAGYKLLVTAWPIEAICGPKCYTGNGISVAHKDRNHVHEEKSRR